MEVGNKTLEKKKHLFRVEIMVEEAGPAMALASLMQVLSHPRVADFRILEGMQFGQKIEKIAAESKATAIEIPESRAVPAKPSSGAGGKSAPVPDKLALPRSPDTPSLPPAAEKPVPPATAPSDTRDVLNLERLTELTSSGTLVRIAVVKSKGIRLSIPCRILKFDFDEQLLTVYHVDEKKVYSFSLNEIEDVVI